MAQPTHLLRVRINPLVWTDVEFGGRQVPPAEVTEESALRFLCGPEADPRLPHLIERYQEISTDTSDLQFALSYPVIEEKFIQPLMHAKASYLTGNFLGLIALCGLVGEMITIMMFQITKVTIQKKPMEENLQKDLFGNSFEGLGQSRRLAVLKAYGIIDDDIFRRLNTTYKTRNKYLHRLTHDHGAIKADAKAVFADTVKVMAWFLGANFGGGPGIVSLRPELIKYLIEMNVIEPATKDAG